jgi:cysteine-rich repeat protein
MRSILLFLGITLCATTAQAEVPQELNYNGFLTNAIGEAVHCPDAIQCTDNYGFAFSLYADEDSTQVLWQESHFVVPIYSGSFMIPLGSINGLSEEVLFEARYVGININGGVELMPRQAIASAPFALLAQTAENSLTAGDAQSLGGLEAGTYATLNDLAALQDGLNPIATEGLPADLADGDDDSLANFACADGMILQANATGAWVCAIPATGGGSTFSGDYNDLSNIPTDQDTLGALTCATGQIPKWEGTGWVCGLDIDTDTTIEDTTIANTTLSEAEVDAMVGNNGYAAQSGLDLEKSDRENADLTLQGNLNTLQAGLSALDPIATTGLPADLADGDDDTDTLGALACADGEVAVRAGAVWICGAAPTAPTGSLLNVVTEPAGANCASGGVRIDQGLDDDASGVLDTAEVDTIQYVCNGAAAAAGGTTPVIFGAEPPVNCTAAALEQQYFDTTIGGYRTCNGQLWIPDISTCGNAVLQPGEECDDGNSLLSDGCHQCLQLGPALCTETCHGTQSMQIYHPAPILLAYDAANSDEFGSSVAISGDTVVVGARYDDDKGSNSGAAYVYVRSGSSWSLQQKLIASDGAENDYFGSSVAIDGDTLVVGAYDADINGAGSGAAYVYTRSGNVWLQQDKLTGSDSVSNDHFGWSVAISGETLVVGARYDDLSCGSDEGSAYVFVRLGGVVWNQQTKLTASDGWCSDEFGRSVSIDGDTLIVGAPYDDDKGSNSGSSYVYRRTAGVWTESVKLVAPDGSSYDYFGYDVAVSGDTLISGAFGRDEAYVYVASGASWTLQQLLKPGQGDGEFGLSVAIDGNSIVVGTHYASPKGSQSGATYVYNRTGTTWVELHYVANPDGNTSDNFGFSVDVDGDFILISSPQDDDLGNESGSAQVFSIQPYCTTQGVCICEFGYGGDDCGTVL